MLFRSKAALSPIAAIGIGLAAQALGWLIYDGLCRSPLKSSNLVLGIWWFVVLLFAAVALDGLFNSRAAYQWSVETSVYLAQDRQRAGGGRMLYAELLHRLTQRGFRRAFAGIAQPNVASNALHQTFGFRPAGHYRRVGWKLGAWHDVSWWQLDLPNDGDDPPRPIAT